MALTLIKYTLESLDELLQDHPELKTDKVPKEALERFYRFAKEQRSRFSLNPRTFYLKIPTVENEVVELCKVFFVYYKKKAGIKVADDSTKSKGEFLKDAGKDLLDIVGDAALKAAGSTSRTTTAPNDAKSDPATAAAQQKEQQKKELEAVPADVRDFVASVHKAFQERQVSIFSCKQPSSAEDVSFASLAGLEFEKEQLRVGYIYPQFLPGMFKNVSKGILLYGPPGTGKTMLARVATAEIKNVAFFPITAGEIKDKYVGETGKALARVWNCATELLDRKPDKYNYAAIFIDEADDLGGSRTGPDPYSKDSVNELLQRMDGLVSDRRISVIAATNYPDRLDSAFLRRFDMRIFIDLPDRMARFAMIMGELAKAYTLPEPEKTPEALKEELERQAKETEEEKRQRLLEHQVYQLPGVKVAKDKPLRIEYLSPAANDVLKNISDFGSVLTETKTVVVRQYMISSTTKTEVTEETLLSLEEILELVERTGPQPSAKDVMKRRKELGGDLEFSDKGISKYGYSASDITKLIQRAVAIASSRAIQDLNAKVFYRRFRKNYYLYDPTSDKSDNRDDYRSINDVLAEDQKRLQELRNKPGVTPEELRSFERRADRIYNFTINVGDVMRAMDQFKPTVSAEEYEAVAKWTSSA